MTCVQHGGACAGCQAWLALNNLVVEPDCRARYDLGDCGRQAALVRLRGCLSDALLDQLPVLRDLQRVLDEVSLGVWAAAGTRGTKLVLEQAMPANRCC
jgi:hypothetical protein